MFAPLSPYMLPSPGMCRRSRHPHYRGATARDILTTAAPLLETSSQKGGRHSIHPHNRGAAARDILTTAAPPLKTSSQPQRRRRRGGCLYKFVGSQSDPSRRRRRRDTLSLSSAHGPQGQNLTREWRVNRCEEGLALGRGTIAITIIRSRFGTPASADAGAGRRPRNPAAGGLPSPPVPCRAVRSGRTETAAAGGLRCLPVPRCGARRPRLTRGRPTQAARPP